MRTLSFYVNTSFVSQRVSGFTKAAEDPNILTTRTDGSQALDELLRRKAGSHAAACSCASRCRISAPCTRNTRKCALYIINATRLRQDHIPQFDRGVCRRHLRATHAK